MVLGVRWVGIFKNVEVFRSFALLVDRETAPPGYMRVYVLRCVHARRPKHEQGLSPEPLMIPDAQTLPGRCLHLSAREPVRLDGLAVATPPLRTSPKIFENWSSPPTLSEYKMMSLGDVQVRVRRSVYCCAGVQAHQVVERNGGSVRGRTTGSWLSAEWGKSCTHVEPFLTSSTAHSSRIF